MSLRLRNSRNAFAEMMSGMDADSDHNTNDMLAWLGQLSVVLLVLIALGFVFFWLLIATIALWVAPEDRPWHFFWCTFFLFGPLGVALALIAQPRAALDDLQD